MICYRFSRSTHIIYCSVTNSGNGHPQLWEDGRPRPIHLGKGLPYLVAEFVEKISDYAYASSYHPITGYLLTLEDSVYLNPELSKQDSGL